MELQDAIGLIQSERLSTSYPQTWADLGCGGGLFSRALESLLAKGSRIYAVDQSASVLEKIPSSGKSKIQPVQADFTKDLPLAGLDGILMANSFHYIKDKPAFIEKAGRYFQSNKQFLFVEYDTDSPVKQWVPYPVSFSSLQKLFKAAGYGSFQKLGERPSVYGRAKIYSVLVGF